MKGALSPPRRMLVTVTAALALAAALFHTGAQLELRMLAALAMLGALMAAWPPERTLHPRFNSIDVAISALTAWLALTILFSSVPFLSTLAWWNYYLFPAAYLLARLVWPTPQLRSWLAGLLITLALLWAVTALVQSTLWGEYPSATFLNRNNLAAWLNLSIPLAAAWWVHAAQRRQWSPGATALLSVFLLTMVIGMIGSRGAFLGLLAAVLAFAFFARRALTRYALLAPAAVAIALGLATANVLNDGYTGARLETLSSAANADAGRWTIWQSALPLLHEAPLTGTGLGTNELVWAPHVHPDWTQASRHLHNDYLEYAVEAGWIASALWLAIVVLVLGGAWRAARSARLTAGERVLVGAAAAAFLSAFVHAMFTFNLRIPAILLTLGFLAGVVATLVQTAAQDPNKRSREREWCLSIGLPALPLALALAAVVGWQAATITTYAWLLRDTAPQADAEVNRTTLTRLGWAMRARPDAAPPRIMYAQWLRLGGAFLAPGTPDRELIYRDALRHLDRAIELNPHEARSRHDRAVLMSEYSEFGNSSDDIEAGFRDALARQPRFLRSRYDLARRLRDEGRSHEALVLLIEGLKWPYPSAMPTLRPYLALTAEISAQHGDTALADALRAQLKALGDVS